MKNIWIFTSVILFISACSTDNSKIILPNYNHSPLGKIRYQRTLQKEAKVDKKEAIEIAQKSCNQKPNFIKIRYHNSLLFYKIKTKSCYLEINAIDGSIIKKETT